MEAKASSGFGEFGLLFVPCGCPRVIQTTFSVIQRYAPFSSSMPLCLSSSHSLQRRLPLLFADIATHPRWLVLTLEGGGLEWTQLFEKVMQRHSVENQFIFHFSTASALQFACLGIIPRQRCYY